MPEDAAARGSDRARLLPEHRRARRPGLRREHAGRAQAEAARQRERLLHDRELSHRQPRPASSLPMRAARRGSRSRCPRRRSGPGARSDAERWRANCAAPRMAGYGGSGRPAPDRDAPPRGATPLTADRCAHALASLGLGNRPRAAAAAGARGRLRPGPEPHGPRRIPARLRSVTRPEQVSKRRGDHATSSPIHHARATRAASASRASSGTLIGPAGRSRRRDRWGNPWSRSRAARRADRASAAESGSSRMSRTPDQFGQPLLAGPVPLPGGTFRPVGGAEIGEAEVRHVVEQDYAVLGQDAAVARWQVEPPAQDRSLERPSRARKMRCCARMPDAIASGSGEISASASPPPSNAIVLIAGTGDAKAGSALAIACRSTSLQQRRYRRLARCGRSTVRHALPADPRPPRPAPSSARGSRR